MYDIAPGRSSFRRTDRDAVRQVRDVNAPRSIRDGRRTEAPATIRARGIAVDRFESAYMTHDRAVFANLNEPKDAIEQMAELIGRTG